MMDLYHQRILTKKYIKIKYDGLREGEENQTRWYSTLGGMKEATNLVSLPGYIDGYTHLEKLRSAYTTPEIASPALSPSL